MGRGVLFVRCRQPQARMEQKRKPRGGHAVHFHKGRRGFSHPSCLLLMCGIFWASAFKINL